MTDRYEKIRKALAKGPMQGPWGATLRDLLAERDALAAEVEALRKDAERLQEIARPKREDECLTLDHWRMRAYALEANWARCSHACAVEQTKREQAEARADKLMGALRELEEREQRDEALLRQALEALELRCGTHADERKELIPALRERLGEETGHE
jgi:chromosome segregation ATPase